MDKKDPVKFINPLNQWKTVILLCLTLGLAPFVPEPHIWGKVNWVASGAVGMQLMDWLDFLFHGFPWILLLRLVIILAKAKFKTEVP